MNSPVYNMRPQRPSAIPNVIFALLIINGVVFALQQMSPRFLLINFALWPAGPSNSPFMPWQLVTYGFLHGNLMHIAFNMFALWMFGQDLERLWGPRRFLTFFLVCVVGAGFIAARTSSSGSPDTASHRRMSPSARTPTRRPATWPTRPRREWPRA